MDNNYHISYLVQAFSSVENGGWNLVLYIVKPLICMIVVSNSDRDPKTNQHSSVMRVSQVYDNV